MKCENQTVIKTHNDGSTIIQVCNAELTLFARDLISDNGAYKETVNLYQCPRCKTITAFATRLKDE